MKNMKKLFAVLLALIMALSLAVPVMADDDTTETYKITIEGSVNNHVPGSDTGHSYIAYQLLVGTMKGVEGEVSKVNFAVNDWGAHIKANAATFLSKLKDTGNDNKVLMVKAEGATESVNVFASVTDAASFAKVLSGLNAEQVQRVSTLALECIDTNVATYNFVERKDSDNQLLGIYDAVVPLGYYLIKDAHGSLKDENGNPIWKDTYVYAMIKGEI